MTNISPDKFRRVDKENEMSEFIARPKITYWSDSWRRFKKKKTALAALVVLSLLILLVIFGPMLSKYSFEQVDSVAKNQGPSAAHWFGTDELGRDIFTRIWVGGRVSIIIGLAGAFICAIIGCIYGAVAAYVGGRVDTIMMRIIETLISLPYLLVVIIISLALDSKSLGTMILAMTITGWCELARLVRGQLLSLKNQEFVIAAETLGVSTKNIILRHLLPNTMNVIIVSISFSIPSFIFSEAFLSYLGIGIQAPMTSWGAMASAAQQQFIFYPYQMVFPALLIALTMLSFTLIGDGLRDALDPQLRD
ncbi:ABC transporter permease [Miniphocaeibacter massiliensis]|uniref:ABC transporter permease n=1 Tax=Miniphocaeibacter massiliensis TaxID=2041841 RepID=UPI000C1C5D54|nr:ABC transporter permease [Miniphocaeibacter massiliensis]